jgi:hypothetical protein
MPKPIQQLLARADDWTLCLEVFGRILKHYGGNPDLSAIPEEERVVLLVWHVSGVVDNGGFRYLFEGDLKGDPYFALTAEAFRVTGCKKAADAVRKTLALFPGSRPQRDREQRLNHYLSRIKAWPTDMDRQFLAAQDDLTKCLAGYIRSHADAYLHLDGPKAKRPPKKRPAPAGESDMPGVSTPGNDGQPN